MMGLPEYSVADRTYLSVDWGVATTSSVSQCDATMNKVCPKCGSNWPKGNFCPKDGASLIDAKPARQTPVSDDAQATRIDRPVIRVDSARGKRPTAPEAKTRLDTPAIKDDGSLSPRRSTPKMPKPPKMVTPGQGQLSGREKDDIAAQTKAEVAAEMPASKPGTTEAETPAAAGEPASRGQKAFSETQWFMKGIEVDADLLEMVDDEDYDRDENISESERKGFTLRREDEE
jgi:hypothetical protein